MTTNGAEWVDRARLPDVGLLTGGIDKPYAFGLAMELLSKNVRVDFIGSDEIDSPEFHGRPDLRFLNLRGDQSPDASLPAKIHRICLYYARLIRYAATARPKVFHILWNNKFQTFDRTVLMLYYRALGKRVVLTAHNVNAARRDGTDSLLNRVTLRIQYQLADHVFVHTEKMRQELLNEFRVSSHRVTVIPFGINNAVPHTELTRADARRRLGLGAVERTILFFGRVGPYKGLEYLVAAFQRLASRDPGYRLIIAGEPKDGAEAYTGEILNAIKTSSMGGQVITRLEYIPDQDTEMYFKAADVLALPYTDVFQSGVLFLAYSFGLPVVASDVGSFSAEVLEGETGFLCKPCDSDDLARALETYFDSDCFRSIERRREAIRARAMASNSWSTIGDITRRVYADLTGRPYGDACRVHFDSGLQQ